MKNKNNNNNNNNNNNMDIVLARTLFFFELTTCSRELATLLVATLGGSFSLEFLELPRLSLEPGLRSINSIMGFALMASLIALLLVLLVSPLVTKLDLDSLTMLLLDHSDKLEIVLALTDLGRKFMVIQIQRSVDLTSSLWNC